LAFNALTMRSFWSGEIRANTDVSRTRVASAASSSARNSSPEQV
jgi:hypothetical protein